LQKISDEKPVENMGCMNQRRSQLIQVQRVLEQMKYGHEIEGAKMRSIYLLF